MTFWSSTRSEGSYVSAEPIVLPPPWIQTITGCRVPAGMLSLAYTLRYKQSSLPMYVPSEGFKKPLFCRHAERCSVVSSNSLQGSAG